MSVELSVVVPFYNEHENIAELYRRLTETLTREVPAYELVFVNDGSHDETPEILRALQRSDPHVVAIHLSRNFGHQAAISAGIDQAVGACVAIMDGDLQDPPEVVPTFVQMWRSGYDVVYAVRTKRKEHLFKRVAYQVFYRLLAMMSEIQIPLDSGDFCVMGRNVVTALNMLPERIRFVRGLRAFVGFRQIGLQYERDPRAAGAPKYTFKALVRLAVDGLVSFSSYPLRVATYLGIVTAMIAGCIGIWVLVDQFGAQTAPRGWASTVSIILLMGAMQLISLGIMGEYIRRIFLESKQRPAYIISQVDRHAPVGEERTA
jgi:dolichol-phosphate mannosyltransferase